MKKNVFVAFSIALGAVSAAQAQTTIGFDPRPAHE